MTVADWRGLGEAIGRIILWLYGGMEWLAFDLFYPFMWWLWNLTPLGWPVWAKLGVAFAFITMIATGIKWLLARRHGAGGIHGRARFATLPEVKAAGMLRPHGRFLGSFKPRGWRGWFGGARDLYMHGEGHCLTIAAQGSGKTTGLIIPTLLTYRPGLNGGTVVVTDPKGAITAQTRRLREKGGRVVVLNPWRYELANDPSFSLDLGDDGFNPLQQVSGTEEGRAAARLVAGLLLPDFPGTDPFWRESARELLEWCMLWQSVVVTDPAARTLPRLHGLVYDQPELVKLLKAISEDRNTQGPGRAALQRGAASLYGLFRGSSATFAGMLSTAKTALSIYDADTHLGRHVSKPGGFLLSDLKRGTPLTVYVICPPNHLVGDDRKWLNLTLAMIAQEVGKPGLARETVLLMDEFPALGYLPNLAGSLEQFREAGLRAHLIAQNPGQILQVYGQDGLTRFWGACETKQFFRITDPNQAKLLSEWLGQVEVINRVRNANGEITEAPVGIPLVRPDELTTMASGRQIIMRPAMRPIIGDVVPYYTRDNWKRMVEPNPYREEGARARRMVVEEEPAMPEPEPVPHAADAAPALSANPAPEAIRAAAGTMVVDEAARKTPEEIAADAIREVQEKEAEGPPQPRKRRPKTQGKGMSL